MSLCAEISMVYKMGSRADGGWFPACLVKSNEKYKEWIKEYLDTKLARKGRKWKGKFELLRRELMKDSENKARRIIREISSLKQEVQKVEAMESNSGLASYF